MREQPSLQDPTNLANQEGCIESFISAGPSGTQRSYSHSGASGLGFTSHRASHVGDGRNGEGQVFERRGLAPGTASLPLPNQPMALEEQATVRRMRGQTGSSVGAGGADPTLHVDSESDKS